MPKRAAEDYCDFEEHNHLRKRHKEAAPLVDNTPVGVKHLPLELREEIYRLALDDVAKQAKHPYDKILPSNARFGTYASVRLVDRHISFEVTRLFSKELADHIIFYVENVPNLHEISETTKKDPVINNARFFLRTGCYNDPRYVDTGLVQDDVEILIKRQPGFNPDWVQTPGFYKEQPRVFAGGPYWNPESDGFHVGTGQHDPETRGQDCIRYREIEYPPVLYRSLRLKNVVWEGTGRCACVVLEGRIRDIDFREYDVQRGIRRLRAYRDELRTYGHECRNSGYHISEGEEDESGVAYEGSEGEGDTDARLSEIDSNATSTDEDEDDYEEVSLPDGRANTSTTCQVEEGVHADLFMQRQSTTDGPNRSSSNNINAQNLNYEEDLKEEYANPNNTEYDSESEAEEILHRAIVEHGHALLVAAAWFVLQQH